MMKFFHQIAYAHETNISQQLTKKLLSFQCVLFGKWNIFFQSFYVFGLVNPEKLKPVYGVLKTLLGMPLCIRISAMVLDFHQQIKSAVVN